MRKINVYKFSEKMPDLGVKLIIIHDGNMHMGTLVDNRETWKRWIAEETDPEQKAEYEDDLKRMNEENRYLVIEWDDDCDDTRIESAITSNWEWADGKE